MNCNHKKHKKSKSPYIVPYPQLVTEKETKTTCPPCTETCSPITTAPPTSAPIVTTAAVPITTITQLTPVTTIPVTTIPVTIVTNAIVTPVNCEQPKQYTMKLPNGQVKQVSDCKCRKDAPKPKGIVRAPANTCGMAKMPWLYWLTPNIVRWNPLDGSLHEDNQRFACYIDPKTGCPILDTCCVEMGA